MAILLDVNTEEVTFGDLAFGSRKQLALALTVTPTVTPATNMRLFSQWGTTQAAEAFWFGIEDTNELSLYVADAGSYYARRTTDVNVANGSRYRILATWLSADQVGGPEIKVWVDGVSRTLAAVDSDIVNTMADSAFDVGVGDVVAAAGMSGIYSEMALWTAKVPDAVAVAYGKGWSAEFYRTDGLLYVRGMSVATLRDEWGQAVVTNGGGSTAAHPMVIRRPALRMPEGTFVAPPITAPPKQAHYRRLRAA